MLEAAVDLSSEWHQLINANRTKSRSFVRLQFMRTIETGRIEVRAAHAADAARIGCLFVELGYPDAGRGLGGRLLQQMGDTGNDILVATQEGEIVGVLVMHVITPLHVARPWAVISALVVDERSRAHGVGAILIAHAQQAASARQCAHVELSCSERRTGAHAFYESQGFAEVRKRFKKELEERE